MSPQTYWQVFPLVGLVVTVPFTVWFWVAGWRRHRRGRQAPAR
jgi:hypothetical protein